MHNLVCAMSVCVRMCVLIMYIFISTCFYKNKMNKNRCDLIIAFVVGNIFVTLKIVEPVKQQLKIQIFLNCAKF